MYMVVQAKRSLSNLLGKPTQCHTPSREYIRNNKQADINSFRGARGRQKIQGTFTLYRFS